MTITSSGSFHLDGTTIVVPDEHVTDSAIILVALQAAGGGGAGSWDGNYGIVDRVRNESFTFSAARPGCGARYAYIILSE